MIERTSPGSAVVPRVRYGMALNCADEARHPQKVPLSELIWSMRWPRAKPRRAGAAWRERRRLAVWSWQLRALTLHQRIVQVFASRTSWSSLPVHFDMVDEPRGIQIDG